MGWIALIIYIIGLLAVVVFYGWNDEKCEVDRFDMLGYVYGGLFWPLFVPGFLVYRFLRMVSMIGRAAYVYHKKQKTGR